MKLEFKAKNFRPELSDIYDRLDWAVDNADEMRSYFKKVQDKNFKQLSTELSKLKKEEVYFSDKREILRWLIAYRLDLFDKYTLDYLFDVLEEQFTSIVDEINSLSKFKEHRHKTIAGLYTEKAVY